MEDAIKRWEENEGCSDEKQRQKDVGKRKKMEEEEKAKKAEKEGDENDEDAGNEEDVERKKAMITMSYIKPFHTSYSFHQHINFILVKLLRQNINAKSDKM